MSELGGYRGFEKLHEENNKKTDAKTHQVAPNNRQYNITYNRNAIIRNDQSITIRKKAKKKGQITFIYNIRTKRIVFSFLLRSFKCA